MVETGIMLDHAPWAPCEVADGLLQFLDEGHVRHDDVRAAAYPLLPVMEACTGQSALEKPALGHPVLGSMHWGSLHQQAETPPARLCPPTAFANVVCFSQDTKSSICTQTKLKSNVTQSHEKVDNF